MEFLRGYKRGRATILIVIVRVGIPRKAKNAMAFIPVPNTALAEVVVVWDGQICENTLYFLGAAAWDATTLTALGGELVAWWNTNIKSLVCTNTALSRVRLTSLESQSAPGIEYTTGLPITGTGATACMPNNVSAAIAFITALRGRSYRGRNYVIGLQEGQVVGNLLDASVAAAYVAAYAALDTAVTANSGQHVVVSRQLNNVPRVTGVATIVTAYSMERVIDSQRRRLPGRGA